MNATCKSPRCKAPVVWKAGANGKPEPFNLDGTTHYRTCVDADRFRGERYDPWVEMGEDERFAFQLELSRESNHQVMACRARPRDAQHGDKWCRNCYQPRPVGYACEAANWGDAKKGTVVRYATVKGEAKPIRGAELRKYLKEARLANEYQHTGKESSSD